MGIRLEMDPGWMTYWRNPGDSGLPTKIAWTLPPGFEAGPLEWPYPDRIRHGALASYGYEGAVLLLAEVKAPASLTGTEVPLAAKVSWLECQEACLPGKADLSMTLPVRPGPPVASAKWAPLFDDARGRLPLPGKGWSATSGKAGNTIVISVTPPAGQAVLETATFFPEQEGRIEPAAEQRWVRAGAAYRLEMVAAANAPEPFTGLKGVLVARAAGRSRPLSLSLDAKPVGASAR